MLPIMGRRGFDGPVGRPQTAGSGTQKATVTSSPVPAQASSKTAAPSKATGIYASFQTKSSPNSPRPVTDRPVAYTPSLIQANKSLAANAKTTSEKTSNKAPSAVATSASTKASSTNANRKTPTGGHFDGPVGSSKGSRVSSSSTSVRAKVSSTNINRKTPTGDHFDGTVGSSKESTSRVSSSSTSVSGKAASTNVNRKTPTGGHFDGPVGQYPLVTTGNVIKIAPSPASNQPIAKTNIHRQTPTGGQFDGPVGNYSPKPSIPQAGTAGPKDPGVSINRTTPTGSHFAGDVGRYALPAASVAVQSTQSSHVSMSNPSAQQSPLASGSAKAPAVAVSLQPESSQLTSGPEWSLANIEICVDSPSGTWKAEARTRVENAPTELAKNTERTRAYAEIYLRDPETFKWAGMASYASNLVGNGMEALTGVEVSVSAVVLNPLVGDALAALVHEVFNDLAHGNDAVYEDIYWQHLAFESAGITEIERMFKAGELNEAQFEAWKLIDEGRNSQDMDLVWEGNKALLKNEQLLLQQEVYDKKPELWVKASKIMKSPIPGGGFLREFSGDANIGNFEDRWAWLEQEMLPSWQDLDQNHRGKVFDDLIDFLSNDTGRPIKKPLLSKEVIAS